MRKDNELLIVANKRIALKEEQAKANAWRFKKWSYRWYHKFHKLPKKEQGMAIFKCTCGRKPALEQVQAFNVIRCDECDKQAFDCDYGAAVCKWNQLTAAIKYENIPEPNLPLQFYVNQAELTQCNN